MTAYVLVATWLYEARDPGPCDTPAACRALVDFERQLERGVDRAAP